MAFGGRNLSVCVRTRETYAGLLRLVQDAERFGLDVAALHLDNQGNTAEIHATFVVPDGMDADNLVRRLGRHPAISTIDVLAPQHAMCEA
jgi:hypothetical protein